MTSSAAPRHLLTVPPRTTTAFSATARRYGGYAAARAQNLGLALIVPAALLGLWQLAASREWVSPQILPAPTIVWATFLDLVHTGEIGDNLLISLGRVAYGFSAGAAIGIALGVTMGLSREFRAYVYPTFNLLAQIPALGWIPLLMMFLGIGETLKIVIIAKAALVPVGINTMQGITNIPESYFEVGRAYRFNRWQTLRKIVLPAIVPSLFNGVRYGLMIAWISLVTVELLASSEGIGFVMVYARQLFQLDVVIVSMFVIGAVGLTFDRLLAVAEGRLLRWRRAAF